MRALVGLIKNSIFLVSLYDLANSVPHRFSYNPIFHLLCDSKRSTLKKGLHLMVWLRT